MVNNSVPDKTVFEKCLDLLNLKGFRCPINDTGAKKLLSGAVILLLVVAELRKFASLSDIKESLEANENLQEYVELDSIHGSSIYRKLGKLPADLLQKMCFDLFQRIHHIHQDKKGIPDLGKLNIIDASVISLPKNAGEWAYCSKSSNGIKLHLRLVVADEKTAYPDRFVLSTSAVSDQKGAIELVIDSDAIYVLDRGYINYHHYNQWLKKGIQFVTRVKASSRLKIVNQRPVAEDSIVATDADVEIKDSETDEIFQLRLVEFKDDQKRLYRIVTSCKEHTAEEIAEIYRHRWLIELFFKWIKGHLNVIKFHNHKPQAVWNQIYISMIAYALCELIKIETKTEKPVWEVLKKLRHWWFKPWDAFVERINKLPQRTSEGRRKKKKRGRPRIHPKKLKAVQIIVQ